jgi:hypothetical protein
VFQLELNPETDPEGITLLGRVQHDGTIRRSVRIGDVLYAISENTVTAHPITDPATLIAKVHFGQEPVGVSLLNAEEDDPVVSMATDSPHLAAPLVLSANAGGSTWSPGVISYLETNQLGSTTSNSGDATTTPSLGWHNVNQIKLTFNEDVAVGSSDLIVTGVNVPSYAVTGFVYDADSRTAVWTLDQALPADHVTVALSDSVTDMAGNRLDGNRDGVAGGQFKFTFNSLPGDVNADGVVNNADLGETIARNFNYVGTADFSLAADIDGDGRVTHRDAIAVRNRMGTTLTPLNPPAAVVVSAPGDGATANRRMRSGVVIVSDPAETPTQRARRVSRGSLLVSSAVDVVIGGAPSEGAAVSGRRTVARRIGRSG